MASSKKNRGPKPAPKTSKRPGPSATPHAPKGAVARRPPGGISKQWWIVIGVAVLALIVGIVVQSTRSKSENAEVVTPKHALGPNDSEIEGAKSAPVLVQEYADFQCPSCKVFHDRVGATVNDLVREKKIRFAYTFFPFLGDESVRAASAAICAGDQDKFFPYADLLYTNQAAENSGFLTADQLVAFGDEVGITGSGFDTFERCVRDGTYEGFARRQAENASKRGVNSTPTVFVTGPNGKTVQLSGAQTLTPALFEQAVADAAAGNT
jgi:protein-disulfide isomerase